MTGATRVLSGAVVAGLLAAAAGHAHAQQDQDLSAREVRSFLERTEQDMTRAVQAGEYARLLDWTEDNLADGATFLLSQEIYVGDERKSFAITSLDKQDMLRLGRVVVRLMSEMPAEAVQDYALDIEVVDVEPIGPNAAKVTTQITESGTLALSGEQDAQPRPEPGQTEATTETGATTRIAAAAECNHLIRRDQTAGHLVIGMTTCQASARL